MCLQGECSGVRGRMVPRIGVTSMRKLQEVSFVSGSFTVFSSISSIPVSRFPGHVGTTIVTIYLAKSKGMKIGLERFRMATKALLVALPSRVVRDLNIDSSFDTVCVTISPRFVSQAFARVGRLLSFVFCVGRRPYVPLDGARRSYVLRCRSFL